MYFSCLTILQYHIHTLRHRMHLRHHIHYWRKHVYLLLQARLVNFPASLDNALHKSELMFLSLMADVI